MEKKIVVAVVMGGPSAECEISLITGKAISIALRERGYEVKEINLDPYNFSEQIKASGAQVVFNAVHGLYGEDGRLQSALEMMGIPYTGSGVCASAMGMDKFATKRVLFGSNIPTPKSLFLYAADRNKIDMKQEILQTFGVPVVVKPASQGSSIGMTIVRKEEEVPGALDLAFKYCPEVLVEEYIDGEEVTVSMMQKDGETVVLPIILIKPHSDYYDFKAKYTAGCADHICPAPLPEAVTKKLQEISLATYKVLGCSGVARTDCMIDKDGQCYVLEINTVPGMTTTSLVPDAAAKAGYSFGDLCEIILKTAHK